MSDKPGKLDRYCSVGRRALAIMAKTPVPGAVKTRLSPPLTPDQSAMLARAFLRDAMLVGLRVPTCTVHVILPTQDDPEPVLSLAPPQVTLHRQSSPGLAEGQRETVKHLLSAGAEVVALIGADLPTLPSAYIDVAFRSLEDDRADLVLGPARDGGYYLIATHGDYPEIFEGIAWSTGEVLDQTLERAAELGLRVELLPEWEDVDDEEGLMRLVDGLGLNGRLDAPATRAALQALERQGALLPESPVPWTVTARRYHFHSTWRSFVEESVVTHNGQHGEYSYLDAPDAVWIVPVTAYGEIVLVRQYRHPVRSWLLEVPAGAVDGMAPADAAAKELREEVGGVSAEIHYLGEFFGSSGNSTHRASYYVAFDVTLNETEHESTELMETAFVPAELAFDMAVRGEISDGQSALAVLIARDHIRSRLASQ
jgi:uncharacterized protein